VFALSIENSWVKDRRGKCEEKGGWNSAVVIVKFFAITQVIAFVGWYALAPLRSPKLRLLLRTLLLSLLLTPGIVIGHGYAVVPAVMVIFARGGLIFGLVPILVVWGLFFLLGSLVQKKRGDVSTESLTKALVTPPGWKSFLYGVMALLLLAGFAAHSAGGINVFTGMAASFLVTYFGGRSYRRSVYLLPLIFTIPLLAAGFSFFNLSIVIPSALLWLAAGVAGGLARKDRRDLAYALGASLAIAFTIMGVDRIRAALRYRNVPHIRIGGGVPMAVAWTVVFLALSVGLSLLAWKTYKKRRRNRP
jgi:hypothetical protein